METTARHNGTEPSATVGLHRDAYDSPDLQYVVLAVREEEQRRIARELHDSTAQTLVAALMQIDRLEPSAEALGQAKKAAFSTARSLIVQSLQEIRTISYLLYPPMLDALGLVPALRHLAHGFSERSNTHVFLELPHRFKPLPEAVESALYRVAQEALTNVHRHSGSATAELRLRRNRREVILEIADHGRGIPHCGNTCNSSVESAAGVGIRSMRARMQQVNGDLAISSSQRGTVVSATAPLQGRADRKPTIGCDAR